MKQIILCLLFIASASASYAQKCNLDVDENDAFSNQHIRSGTSRIGSIGRAWKFTLSQKGDKYSWAMVIKWDKHFTEPIAINQVISLKFENGKVLQLFTDKDYAPTFIVLPDNSIISTYLPGGDLTLDQIKVFCGSNLTNLRITLAGEDFDPEITSKQGKRITEVARCLFNDGK